MNLIGFFTSTKIIITDSITFVMVALKIGNKKAFFDFFFQASTHEKWHLRELEEWTYILLLTNTIDNRKSYWIVTKNEY